MDAEEQLRAVRRAVVTLLDHYRDVLEGVPDGVGRSEDDLALMCPAWNHASYQQLEKLLTVMHARWPRLRQAIRVRYERYAERRVAFCRVCKGTEHASSVGRPHRGAVFAGKPVYCRLDGKVLDMLPRLERVLPRDDDPATVNDAIEWLVRHWNGSLDLPKSVREMESQRRLREAA